MPCEPETSKPIQNQKKRDTDNGDSDFESDEDDYEPPSTDSEDEQPREGFTGRGQEDGALAAAPRPARTNSKPSVATRQLTTDSSNSVRRPPPKEHSVHYPTTKKVQKK
ncbi:hypothetical protein HYDPIDRAFT_31223 [Hydnomerulius pinastri MD-312]|uniref:Uncharacterized protein n=1 Tax=Hydnomerulius pinastri MD-312 TaxID=994086 RepID=A0A0C9V7J7_9AGAM|nr:hypothetical protein HYDPIDRAFT_31223 [Hydnomerulius pinastri MD-312]